MRSKTNDTIINKYAKKCALIIIFLTGSDIRHRVCCALSQNYTLGFDCACPEWNGAVATVLPSPGNHVWGVVWQLQQQDLANLDR